MSQRYLEDLVEQLHEESEHSQSVESTDENLIETVDKADTDPEYIQRNHAYTVLLTEYITNYKDKAKAKEEYKCEFFRVTINVFQAISIATIFICIMVVLCKEHATIADVSIVISAFAGMISALMIIPRIIAEYLFPADEESYMIQLVKSMQDNDSQIRRSFRAHKACDDIEDDKIKIDQTK